MIKIFARQLVKVDNGTVLLDSIQQDIEKFLRHPFTDPLLKFDIQVVLADSVIAAIEDLLHFRNNLITEYPQDKKDNVDKVNKQLFELLNSEIEIAANPIKLTRLKEEDCSTLNFAILKPFIQDDRNEQSKNN